MARMNDAPPNITRIGEGMYRIQHEGRNEVIYVAGSAADRWVFWNGEVYRVADSSGRQRERSRGAAMAQALTAPMPARVLKILVVAGTAVKKGDTLVVLEAMKMELPVRAPANATVTGIHCREGELVAADAVLLDLG
jgi:biotin carboxyl carrier protein